MSYQVLARKWRPKHFEEMVGQAHVLRALINALDEDRLHHAYLFTGTRGVGKTTIARIIAKSLNCEQGVSSKPCGQCSTCTEINEGRFVDLIEVDAASRTKVEDTRELLENVQYAPTRGRYKVYLIDEVHMLSTSSFNALLKTLEEPPPHVKFLLATTDPQKLPATVLSRCLQFHLKRMPIESIIAHHQHILGQEGIAYEDAALKLIARAADGSMRDSLSLLDQAIAFGHGQVNAEPVAQMLGAIANHLVVDVLSAVIQQNAEQLLTVVKQLTDAASDVSAVLDELITGLHQMALHKQWPAAVDTHAMDSDKLIALAEQVSDEQIQLLYQIAVIGKRDLPLLPDPQLGLEMTVLRMLSFDLGGLSTTQASTAGSATPPKSSAAATQVAALNTHDAAHASDDVIERVDSADNSAQTLEMAHDAPLITTPVDAGETEKISSNEHRAENSELPTDNISHAQSLKQPPVSQNLDVTSKPLLDVQTDGAVFKGEASSELASEKSPESDMKQEAEQIAAEPVPESAEPVAADLFDDALNHKTEQEREVIALAHALLPKQTGSRAERRQQRLNAPATPVAVSLSASAVENPEPIREQPDKDNVANEVLTEPNGADVSSPLLMAEQTSEQPKAEPEPESESESESESEQTESEFITDAVMIDSTLENSGATVDAQSLQTSTDRMSESEWSDSWSMDEREQDAAFSDYEQYAMQSDTLSDMPDSVPAPEPVLISVKQTSTVQQTIDPNQVESKTELEAAPSEPDSVQTSESAQSKARIKQTEPEPSQPEVIQSAASSQLTPQGWLALVPRLSLTALAMELAMNAALKQKQGNRIQLLLGDSCKHLKQDKLVQALTEALGQYWGAEQQVNIQLVADDDLPETAAKHMSKQQILERQRLEQAIENDVVVKQLQVQFGATIDYQSIRAIELPSPDAPAN